MTVTPLSDPDTSVRIGAERPALPVASDRDAGGFARAVEGAIVRASDALTRADAAERAFVRGRGGLQEMTLERAQADIALSIASATTSRVAQALQTILGMQV